MKKILSIILVLSFILILFCSCTQSPTIDTENPPSTTVVNSTVVEETTNQNTEFNKEIPYKNLKFNSLSDFEKIDSENLTISEEYDGYSRYTFANQTYASLKGDYVYILDKDNIVVDACFVSMSPCGKILRNDNQEKYFSDEGIKENNAFITKVETFISDTNKTYQTQPSFMKCYENDSSKTMNYSSKTFEEQINILYLNNGIDKIEIAYDLEDCVLYYSIFRVEVGVMAIEIKTVDYMD